MAFGTKCDGVITGIRSNPTEQVIVDIFHLYPYCNLANETKFLSNISLRTFE